MLHDDRRFRSPWKAISLPRAKKALHALVMLSVAECLAERLEFHQTPRHIAASEVETSDLPIGTTVVSWACLDILTTSSFVV